MGINYIPNKIEKRMQIIWEKHQLFHVKNNTKKKNITVYQCFHILVENFI